MAAELAWQVEGTGQVRDGRVPVDGILGDEAPSDGVLGNGASGNVVELRDVVRGPASTARSDERLLPVADELVALLTQPGIVRGSVLTAQGPGALTLATAFAAETSRVGGWVAAVGLSRMGVSAVAERGASLDRWAFVDHPGDAVAEVLNALIGNVDVILLASNMSMATAHSRRLRARLRERGTAVIEIAEPGPARSRGVGAFSPAGSRGVGAFSPDVTMTTQRAAWTGLGQGHGRLRARRAEITATGRGAASLRKRVVLWLPGPDGRIAPVRGALSTTGLGGAGVSGAAGSRGAGVSGAAGSRGAGVSGAVGSRGAGVSGAVGSRGAGVSGAVGSRGAGVSGAVGSRGAGVSGTALLPQRRAG